MPALSAFSKADTLETVAAPAGQRIDTQAQSLDDFAKSQLRLNEVLVGAFRRRESVPGRLHPAALERAIEDLGLRFGTPVVDNLMALCHIGGEGLVDFSRFAESVKSARSDADGILRRATTVDRVRTQEHSKALMHGGDLAHGLCGYDAARTRYDETHARGFGAGGPGGLGGGGGGGGGGGDPLAEEEARARASTRQAAALRGRASDLSRLFARWNSNELDACGFTEGIERLDIVVTPKVQHALTRSHAKEFTYSDLVKSLGNLETGDARHATSAGRKAGEPGGRLHAQGSTASEHNAVSGSALKVDRFRGQSTLDVPGLGGTGNGPSLLSSGQRIAGADLLSATAVPKKTLHSSDKIKAVMDLTNTPEDPGPQTSESRAKLAGGRVRRAGFGASLRVWRQQAYSLIRKLDSGEITTGQFEKQLAAVGIEMPREVRAVLNSHRASGVVPFTAIATAFERYFEEREKLVPDSTRHVSAEGTPPMEVLRKAVAETLRSGFVGLRNALRVAVARVGEPRLKFPEWMEVLESLGLMRALDGSVAAFQHVFDLCDTASAGAVDAMAFLRTLRGPMGPARHRLVNAAFLGIPGREEHRVANIRKLDHGIDEEGYDTYAKTHAEYEVPLDSLMAFFKADRHPAVAAGDVRAGQVEEQLLEALGGRDDDDGGGGGGGRYGGLPSVVTLTDFMESYENISAAVASDAEFAETVQACWSLDPDLPPPRPSDKRGPSAQTHGDLIAWNHTPSQLENRNNAAQSRYRIKRDNRNHKAAFNVTAWGEGGQTAVEAEMEARFGRPSRFDYTARRSSGDIVTGRTEVTGQAGYRGKALRQPPPPPSSPDKHRVQKDRQGTLARQQAPFGVDPAETAALQARIDLDYAAPGERKFAPVSLSTVVKRGEKPRARPLAELLGGGR